MQMRLWITGALLLTFTSAPPAQASPSGREVNQYIYYGPKKLKKKAAPVAPALTRVPESKPAPAPAPTYTQTHEEPAPVASAPQTYSQTHSPGPNSGKAANGTWTPGGASILSTGPLYYSFPFQGGYGPITLAPIVGGGYQYNSGYQCQYNPYSANPNCAPPPTCEPCPPPAPPAPPAPPYQAPPLSPHREAGAVAR